MQTRLQKHNLNQFFSLFRTTGFFVSVKEERGKHAVYPKKKELFLGTEGVCIMLL